MENLPLILAGLVAAVTLLLAILSSWVWLLVSAGAMLAGVVIVMRRQRA
jgi:hypothetical protein